MTASAEAVVTVGANGVIVELAVVPVEGESSVLIGANGQRPGTRCSS